MSAASAAASENWIGNSIVTDDRPRPHYGEYAPLPPAGSPAAPVAAVPPVSTPVAPPAPGSVGSPSSTAVVAPQPRRVRDVILTTTLLLCGVVDVVSGFAQYGDLAGTLRATYVSQNYPAFTADALANTMGLAINVARVTLLVAAIIASLLLIRVNRRAFWVPLAAAVVGAIVVTVCVLVVILTDPALGQYLATQTSLR